MLELKHGEVITVAPIFALNHERWFIRGGKIRLFETSTGISGVFELENPWLDGVVVSLVPGSAFVMVGVDGVLVVDDNQDLQVMAVGEYEVMESMCTERIILSSIWHVNNA